jgi:hypothetical protein
VLAPALAITTNEILDQKLAIYDAKLPPNMAKGSSDPTEVFVQLTLQHLYEVKENLSRIEVALSVTIMWYDERLISSSYAEIWNNIDDY